MDLALLRPQGCEAVSPNNVQLDSSSPERTRGTGHYFRPSLGFTLALTSVLAVGVSVRLVALGAPRSLWLDEAMLAMNVCGRTFGELWKPLDYQQGAPYGFLALERLAVVALGPTEWALRLTPFIASLLALGLVYRAGRTLLGPTEALIALSLTALLPGWIYYSAEAKQYALDVALGLLFLGLASRVLREGWTSRRAFGLAVAGMIAIWFSHPVVFVLAGVGTTLLMREIVGGRTKAVCGVLLVLTSWVASFAAEYVLQLQTLRANQSLATFWTDAFLPFPPRSAGDARRYVVTFFGLFEAMYQSAPSASESGIETRMSVAAALVGLAGVAVLWRERRREILALLLLPVAFAVLAAMLHQYPLRQRLALFTSGPIILVMASGLGALFRSTEPVARGIGWAWFAGLLLLPGLQAVQEGLQAPRPYGARTVLTRLAQEWRPGDLVLVDAASEPPLQFYREYGGIPGLQRIQPTLIASELRKPEDLEAEARRIRQRHQARAWFLFTAHMRDPAGREDAFLKRTLDHLGRPLAEARAEGYYAWLYDFRTEAALNGG